jgi:hypothetical protein
MHGCCCRRFGLLRLYSALLQHRSPRTGLRQHGTKALLKAYDPSKLESGTSDTQQSKIGIAADPGELVPCYVVVEPPSFLGKSLKKRRKFSLV